MLQLLPKILMEHYADLSITKMLGDMGEINMFGMKSPTPTMWRLKRKRWVTCTYTKSEPSHIIESGWLGFTIYCYSFQAYGSVPGDLATMGADLHKSSCQCPPYALGFLSEDIQSIHMASGYLLWLFRLCCTTYDGA